MRDIYTYLIELVLELDDLFCLDLDVSGLPARPARRLVYHDTRVWQRVPHSVLTCRLGSGNKRIEPLMVVVWWKKPSASNNFCSSQGTAGHSDHANWCISFKKHQLSFGLGNAPEEGCPLSKPGRRTTSRLAARRTALCRRSPAQQWRFLTKERICN